MAAMTGVMTLNRTTIGLKAIMAISGLIGVGFVVFHMIGNLKLFLGPQEINDYAVGLRYLGYPIVPKESLLWVARIVLVVAVVAHVWSAILISKKDIDSRPIGYTQYKRQASTYAARTMRYGGIYLTLFIVYHVAHLTFGVTAPNYQYLSVYNNLIYAFREPITSVIYIVGMIFLGLHLYHGFWSAFQTFGINNYRLTNGLRITAGAIALAVVVGNVAIPLAVLLGVVQPAPVA